MKNNQTQGIKINICRKMSKRWTPKKVMELDADWVGNKGFKSI